MAQYRATIQGQRGQASRLGGKKSGMSATINGWHSGVEVVARYDKEKNEDVFEVFRTTGSDGRPDHVSGKLAEIRTSL